MNQLTKYLIVIILTALVSSLGTYGALTFTQPTEEPKETLDLNAGFIYVGPALDYGFSHAHDRGRKIVDERYDWLSTTYAESISENDVGGQIDTMFDQGADVIFATSFGFMGPTVDAGSDWPNKMLYHCSGGPTPYQEITGKEFQADNVGFYFADFYQIYYLNGLLAGAMAESDKIGYVAAHTTSEVVRHMNSFLLGAKEVNPDVTMKVIETGGWYDPSATTTATNSLISWGADSIGYTQDSTAAVQTAQSHYNETGEKVYTFSHYTPMKSEGSDVVLSGQLVRWDVLYEELLLKARSGVVEPSQHWRLLGSGAVEMGSDWDEPINPDFVDDLKDIMVTDPVLGEVSVYNLTMTRLEQFKALRVAHHPFTGPLYDSEGNLRLSDGEVISQEDLRWHMDWYVNGTVPPT